MVANRPERECARRRVYVTALIPKLDHTIYSIIFVHMLLKVVCADLRHDESNFQE